MEDVAGRRLYRYPELARKAGLTSLLRSAADGPGVIGTLNIYSGTGERLRRRKSVSRGRGRSGRDGLENARLMSETLEMKRNLEARKIVERAKGILQQRDGLTEEDAYLHLRGESRRLRRPMKELAEAIILAEELHRKSERN